jgi:transposase
MKTRAKKINAKRQKKNKTSADNMRVVHPNAAGIDIGSRSHYVAVPADRDSQPIREFDCFTGDLYAMADWLENCGIKTVAMESTGVYWIPAFQILEERGFEVCLVNASHVKNVPGRKTDVKDARWLQQLHSFGLLSASFRPNAQVCALRAYVRHRGNLVKASSPHILRMQKALTQMNVQLHKVISDITGVTGLRIIDAILAGERDPMTLAAMKDCRIAASVEDVARSLEGDLRDEHIFVLRQELAAYRFFTSQIEACDTAIVSCLAGFDELPDVAGKPLAPGKKGKGRRHPSLREQLYKITGVDLTAIPGLDALSIQNIIAETGLDMSKWPREKQFTSWATLAPKTPISGGRPLTKRGHTAASRVGQMFRMAAESLSQSQSALGEFYRRMRARLGPPKAIKAAAHKLARIFYRMLKHRKAFQDAGAEQYNARFRTRQLKNLKQKAAAFGLTLVAVAGGAQSAQKPVLTGSVS